jgi:nucleoside-diphosphate-sugar epimerase
MKVLVIGGSGHIGTYLVPRLVERGHSVINITRGKSAPYQYHSTWERVENILMDRNDEEKSGTFGKKICDLNVDVIIDLICFEPDSARLLVESLRGKIQQLLMCGTIWVHGYGIEIPTVESQPRKPFGDYGIKKAQIEELLLTEARRNNFPVTVLHPGHIAGPGWPPVNPVGNFNPKVFETLAKGEELTLPNFGLETVHHVHADDVAQAFIRSMDHWNSAVGESFHVVSSTALTLRGYAETVASWFKKEARLKFLPWKEWKKTVSEEDADFTWDHIAHSPNMSIEKAKSYLRYQPRYSSLQAVYESVQWLIEHKIIEVQAA